MNIDIYCKAPKDVMRCHGFLSPSTGKFVEMKSTDKLILFYMLDKTTYHSNNGRQHFETQVTIGDAIGVEFKAAARSLKRFVDNGVIVAKKERNLSISPHLCYYYKSVNTDTVFLTKEEYEDTEKEVDNSEIPDSIGDIDYTDEFLAGIQWE